MLLKPLVMGACRVNGNCDVHETSSTQSCSCKTGADGFSQHYCSCDWLPVPCAQSLEHAGEAVPNGTATNSSSSPPTNGTGSPPAVPLRPDTSASAPVPIPGAHLTSRIVTHAGPASNVLSARLIQCRAPQTCDGFVELAIRWIVEHAPVNAHVCHRRVAPGASSAPIMQATWPPAAAPRARRSSAAA